MTAAARPPERGTDDEAPGRATDPRPQENEQASTDSIDEAKRFATVAAEAALLRCSVYRLASGGFLLTRQGWGLSRELPTLREVAGLLRLMSGKGAA